LHAEVDQVGGAGNLDHREGDHRAFDQRTEPERHTDHLQVDTGGIAYDGQQGLSTAGRQRAADHEHHARSWRGDHDERQRRERRCLLEAHHRRRVELLPRLAQRFVRGRRVVGLAW